MSAPLLTVALVVYRDQGYIREAVRSVLDQSFRHVELLALDNASPDHGPEILGELAGTDDRLVVVRLDRTESLGEARNRALDRANGDYLWFLESTDLLPAGALSAVAARLEQTNPQVLVVGETRIGPSGRERPAPRRGLLRAAAGDLFTLDERPEAVGLAPDAWSKIFAREHLRALGARFGAGGAGELTVTYPALLAAQRIGVLERTCYVRRRPANAADDPRVHGKPFDVWAQYEEVFRFVDSQGAKAASRRSLLSEAMLRHGLELLDQVPDDERGRFFAELSEAYGRDAREGDRLTGDASLRLQERLVRENRYGPFRAVRWAAGGRRGAKARGRRVSRVGSGIANRGRREALRAHYRLQLRRSIEPDLAVFAAYWYSGYSCNPKAIFEKLRELAPRIRGIWIVDEAHAGRMPEGVDYVVAGRRDYYSLVARARYFVNNVGFPEEVVKRAGTIRVHTHHGTPLKTMGLDLRDAFIAGPKTNVERQVRRCARWDYSLSQNAFTTLVWERAYPGRYETLEVGYPRNDVLVNSGEGDVGRIRAELGIEAGRRTVLYAPTHREYLRRQVPMLDVRRLAEGLGPDYTVMVRAHYRDDDKGLADDLPSSGMLDVTRHPSIEDLCLAADVLITDYSSVMFDYAVLDRPLVIHTPDWDVYRTLRGTYFDLPAEPPGIVTTSDEELLAAFGSGAVWGNDAAELRAAFRARFCYLDDGRAAERVIRRVWASEVSDPEAEVPPERMPLARAEA